MSDFNTMNDHVNNLIKVLQDLSDGNLSNSTKLTETIKDIIDERNRYAAALEYINSGVMITDPSLPDNPIIYVNKGFTEITGYTEEEVIGKNPRFLQGEKTDRSITSRIYESIFKGNTIKEELINYRKDGSYYWNELNISPVMDENQNIKYFIGLSQDITERKETEQKLKLAKLVFENVDELIMVFNREWEVVSVNKRFEKVTGFQIGDVISKKVNEFTKSRYSEGYYRKIAKQVIETKEWEGELWLQTKNGSERLFSIQLSIIEDRKGEIEKYLAVLSDITELKESEERIKYLAYHDSLTGLPNRERFIIELEKKIDQKEKTAVIFIDLDHFKQVNDTLGHLAGDLLLKDVANRLEKRVLEKGLVARMGGDEFTILVSVDGQDKLATLVEDIIEEIRNPFFIKGEHVLLTTSLGVAQYPEDGDHVDILLQKADQAMYKAKHSGRNDYKFWGCG